MQNGCLPVGLCFQLTSSSNSTAVMYCEPCSCSASNHGFSVFFNDFMGSTSSCYMHMPIYICAHVLSMCKLQT